MSQKPNDVQLGPKVPDLAQPSFGADQRREPRVTLVIRTAKIVADEREFLCIICDASDTHKDAILETVKAGNETVFHPQLTQTGTDLWDAFLVASRTIGQAESDTYPAVGDPCLLCHRPLDVSSATLIRRMWQLRSYGDSLLNH